MCASKACFNALVGCAIVLSVSVAPAMGGIMVTDWSLNVQAQYATSAQMDTNDTVESFPFLFDHNAAMGGEEGFSESYSEYDFNVAGDVATFGIVFEHTRVALPGSLARSFGPGSGIGFTTANDLLYDISGVYALQDGLDRILMSVQLVDVTDSVTLFDNIQESRGVEGQVFNVGEDAGNYANTLAGSLSGTLLAGHAYTFSWEYLIEALPDGDGSEGYAEGNLSLGLEPVPEPSSLCLLLLVGVAVVCRRR